MRAKRPHEVEILLAIMDDGQVDRAAIARKIEQEYNRKVSQQEMDSAIVNLTGKFVSNENELKKYMEIDMIESDQFGRIKRVKNFYDRLTHSIFNKYLLDLVELSRERLRDMYLGGQCEGAFVLYEKYSRRDVCQLLNCQRDLSSTMYGMKRIGEDACIFVTYDKQEDMAGREYVEGKPNYADEFINNQIFMWDSQMGKGPDSSYMKQVLTADRRHLFVKKSDAEGKDYYYMGLFDVVEAKPGQKEDLKGKMRNITKVMARMHHEVREDLLDYLRNSI